MQNSKETSIVICCAGMGTRLGIGTTKALVHIGDKPLIIRQLELLKEYDDIRIVVGYQAKQVIDVVNSYRKDIMFAFNYDFENTGVADSVFKGSRGARENIIMIDGDIIVRPEDFKTVAEHEGECICYNKSNSANQVYVRLNNDNCVTGFTNETGHYEWSGIAKVKSKRVKTGKKHVYQMLEDNLPIKGIEIHSIDVDTVEDYERAVAWINNNYRNEDKI